MEFVLAFQQGLPSPVDRADPEAQTRRQQLSLAWKDYMGAMASAGVLRAGKQLDPSSSVIIGCTPSSAPSTVQLGGYALLDVPSLKEALFWAERSPANQHGYTQVLPVLPIPRPSAAEAP